MPHCPDRHHDYRPDTCQDPALPHLLPKPLLWIVPLSLVAMALLMYLRSTYPAAFPNCEYISCT